MPADVRDGLSLSQGTKWDDLPENVVARIVPMSQEPDTPANYRKMLRLRTKEARLARGWSQAEIANFLGIDVEAYKKYETRTPLPHHLVEQFCTLTGIEIGFYMTGRMPQKVAVKKRAAAI